MILVATLVIPKTDSSVAANTLRDYCKNNTQIVVRIGDVDLTCALKGSHSPLSGDQAYQIHTQSE